MVRGEGTHAVRMFKGEAMLFAWRDHGPAIHSCAALCAPCATRLRGLVPCSIAMLRVAEAVLIAEHATSSIRPFDLPPCAVAPPTTRPPDAAGDAPSSAPDSAVAALPGARVCLPVADPAQPDQAYVTQSGGECISSRAPTGVPTDGVHFGMIAERTRSFRPARPDSIGPGVVVGRHGRALVRFTRWLRRGWSRTVGSGGQPAGTNTFYNPLQLSAS